MGDFLLLLGAFFCFTASLGIWRFPDVYCRGQISSKTVTLGVSLMALGLLPELSPADSIFPIAIVVIFFLTAPVTSHFILLRAYEEKSPLWTGTLHDDLSERQ